MLLTSIDYKILRLPGQKAVTNLMDGWSRQGGVKPRASAPPPEIHADNATKGLQLKILRFYLEQIVDKQFLHRRVKYCKRLIE